MEERKEIVCKIVSEGMTVAKALSMAEIPRSSYYYKSNGKRKGKKPLGFSLKEGIKVTDKVVINDIKDIVGEDFIDYGYERTTHALRKEGYLINKKKVYRLMKENNLLLKQFTRGTKYPKTYVEFTKPESDHPFHTIEIDIKYIYLAGLKTNSYLITLIDVYTRLALCWTIGMDMKAKRVIALLDELVERWFLPYNIDPAIMKVKLRSDNGPQFISNELKGRLNEMKLNNEFIKPATPQQNGHIESFHNTVSRLVCNKYDFDDLKDANEIFTGFYKTYNEKRIMKAIDYNTPIEHFNKWVDNHSFDEIIKEKYINKYDDNNFFQRKESFKESLPLC